MITRNWAKKPQTAKALADIKEGLIWMGKTLKPKGTDTNGNKGSKPAITSTKWLNVELRNPEGRAAVTRLAANEGEIFDRMVVLCNDGMGLSIKCDNRTGKPTAYAFFPVAPNETVQCAVSAFGSDAHLALTALLIKVEILLQGDISSTDTAEDDSFG